VHSCIVTIIPRKPQLNSDLITKVRKIAHFAFTARRKMLKTSLKSVPESILLSAGLDPHSRAENVSPDGYLALAWASL
jgi:16S rRNA A1518/A1519 N6-dimethyltransferase RsmA/KsgA/DIM1 with predicted DNA glycosylase/AP lyase activity